MKKINLIERNGVLLDKKEMKIGAILFAYSEMFENMSLVEINENKEAVVLDSATLSGVTENLTNFKRFLNKAKLFCKNENCKYEDLWDEIITNDNLETLKKLQRINLELGSTLDKRTLTLIKLR